MFRSPLLQEYQPSPSNPWDRKKVGHLYRRATFGANWSTLEKAWKAGPRDAITQLLQGDDNSMSFEQTSDYMASRRSLPASASNTQLMAWWLHRMLNNPHSLREKVALIWHNHFATSNTKVQNAQWMVQHYRLIHRHALGDFRTLLKEMSFDPAMLVWLDAKDSKKGKPNENYARELMELFSLGIGNYREADIREAARAFTGYDVKNNQCHFDAKQHDDGMKTVLGESGQWKGEDIVRICLEQPACAKFIVSKFYRALISEVVPPDNDVLTELADYYRKTKFDTGKLVEVLLRSNLFFSEQAYRMRIKSPVEFALGMIKAFDGRVGPLPLATAMESLGQVLFAPPSVKGWDGGPTWLNGQTLLFRQNLALNLTSGLDDNFGRRCDPMKILRQADATNDDQALSFLLTLLLQSDVGEEQQNDLQKYLKESQQAKYPPYWTSQDVQEHRLRTLAHFVLTLPEYQLC